MCTHGGETSQDHVEGEINYEMVYPILVFFEFNHLPENLQNISKHFYHLAYELVGILPKNAETSTALRKLLEAKDCAVRAIL